MSEFLHDDEYLIRYLDKELSVQEQEELESKIQSDESLRARIKDLELVRKAVIHAGIVGKVREIHKHVTQRTPSLVPFKRILGISIAAAASILVIFFALTYFRGSLDENSLYQEAFVDYQIGHNRSEGDMTPLQSAFINKQYQTVIATRAVHSLDSLIKAVAFMHLDQPVQASDILERLLDSKSYNQDAEFYLALNYLKQKRINAASGLIKRILSDPDHIYHSRFRKDFIQKLGELGRNQNN